MAKDVSAIATLIFAENITTAATSATAIKAASLDSTSAYEAVQDGCIRGLGVTIETVAGGAYTYTFTVYVAGVATNVTVTLGAAATTGYAAFANNIALVKAGDAITCTVLQSSASADDPDNTLAYVVYQLGESNI